MACRRHHNIRGWVCRVTAALLCSTAINLLAQTSGQDRRFELATVRVHAADTPQSIERRGNRLFVVNAPLDWLIKWAFDLDDERVLNIPGGANQARFDIVAQAPEENPARGRMQLMMQTLLRERFGLRVHDERRPLVSYALLLDKQLKVHVMPDDGRPAPPNPFSMSEAGRLNGTRVTAAMLARVLTDQLHRPVKDETHLSGFFDFAMEWMPDTAVDSPDPSRPSLFTALREQLGFRLEARRTPVQVLVVEAVMLTPTSN